MDKLAQLQETLGQLSPEQARRLARALELDRALGKQGLPSVTILDKLRPTLRLAKPPRVPTLCRLICAGIEVFLTDRVDEPRLEGLIPRRSIPVWWSAATSIAGDEIAALEDKLRAQLKAEPVPSLEPLQYEAVQAARVWCATLLEQLDERKRPRMLRQRVSPEIARDIGLIAEVLPLARPINLALKSLMRVATRLEIVANGRLLDLPPDCITLLKQHYLDMSEKHGTDARFLALAVLNRLEQPRQILRLARARSWKPNDTLVANTEFFCIGARLIGDIERSARAVLVLTPSNPSPTAPAALAQALIQYFDAVEGLVSEIGLRRDSPWGSAILKTRGEIADAIDRDFLAQYAETALAILPMTKHRMSDLTEPPGREIIEAALAVARLLQLLLLRGERHGFTQAARETVGRLDAALEDRVAGLCEAAQTMPERAAVIEAQARAAAELAAALFDRRRAAAITRDVAAAIRRSA